MIEATAYDGHNCRPSCCANGMGQHPLVITIARPVTGRDDGHGRRPSRTIRCMLVTDHDHHGVSDRDGRGP
eukprot:3176812-Prymnesium_polylepis.1